MSLKDQFRDKANQLRERAEKAGQGAKDGVSGRAAGTGEKRVSGEASSDDVRDGLDGRA
ncbi:hypothetical protein AB0D45_25725 [Streptomyces sp. NPDC048352]|uniref:hypothetical protein n=1 Tax=Streptomyces sp. NPDC048352 TaxID=3154718 RepID=UPI0034170660